MLNFQIKDKFYFLTETKKIGLPTPGTINNLNKNNFIISLKKMAFYGEIADLKEISIL